MRYINRLTVAAGAGCLAAALVGTAATPALADYGPGAQFQVEISANNVGGVPGDGVWLWIELNRDGGGDYTGSDCIHSGPGGPNGAGHQRGDVEWTDSGGKLTITGVALVDAQFPVIIVVPDRYGHYVLASDSVIQDFALGQIGGTAQVQVAP
ncbi:MAG TPA: hypothetical protein VGQ26_26750 [Streptosporangiaceae bacterium]|nr:hypothetical protein [Streptosporangiaceae bacterium]